MLLIYMLSNSTHVKAEQIPPCYRGIADFP